MINQVNKRLTLILFAMLLPVSFIVQATVASPTPEDKINSLVNASQPIAIKFTKKTFTDVAATIEQQSKIQIQIAPVLKNHLLTANIKAENWLTAIPKLLKGYNWVGIMKDNGQLGRVLVTGINNNGTDVPNLQKQLFNYVDKSILKSIPEHLEKLADGSVTRIKFNKTMLKNMTLGDVLSLSLPAGQFNVIYDNIMLDENGDFTWVGYLEGVMPKNRVILSFDKKSSFGRILTPEGVFRVESSEGLDWLVDVGSAGLTPGTLQHDSLSSLPVGTDLPQADLKLSDDNATLITKQTTSFPFKVIELVTKSIFNSNAISDSDLENEPVVVTDSDITMQTIDVMVLYLEGVANNRIKNLIATANQAYKDSNVLIQLRLVHAQRVNYTNHTSNETALYDLTNNHLSSLYDITALRKKHGADLVSLIRPFKVDVHQGCGIAWLGGSGGRRYYKNEAFSVTSNGIDGTRYCTDYTLAHELSHNMGSSHDRQNTNFPGKFSYSYGYIVGERYGTIMSYSAIDLGLFSNPTIDCLDQPCGMDTANNALSLNNSAAAITRFMKPAYPIQNSEVFK